MKSELFSTDNLEIADGQRFGLQNNQLLRVSLGPDVLAVKGAMVAYQGQIRFDHEKAGSVGKLLKKMVTSEDMPLMRVSGQGEVFFANEAGYVYLLNLEGDGISVNGRNLLAFDAALQWDINRVKGAGILAGDCSTPPSPARARSRCAPSGSRSCSTARSSRRTSTPRPASRGRRAWSRASSPA